MAVANSNYANQLAAATFEHSAKLMVDNVYKKTPTLAWLKRHQKVIGSGTKTTWPIRYAGSGHASGFTTGGSFTLASSDTVSRTQFEWFNYGVPILLYDQEMMMNSGDAQIIDLAKEKMEEAELDLADTFATDLFASSYTDGSKNIIPALPVVLDATSTIGGIAYDAFAGDFEWQAQVTSSVTFSIGMLETIYNNCAEGKGGLAPTVLFGFQDMVESYKNLAGDYITIEARKGGQAVDLGFDKVFFRGKPFYMENYMSAGQIMLLNEAFVNLVAHKRNAKKFVTERKPVSAVPGAVEHSIWGMYSFRLTRRASLGRCHTITAVT